MPQFVSSSFGTGGFIVDQPIEPGAVSRMSFRLGNIPGQPDQFDLAASRPDGSKRHLVRFTRRADPFPFWLSGSDPRPYSIGDGGTWILYDPAGKPWMRYVAQMRSWYSAIDAPERIVTAGEKVTIGTRLVGWSTGSTLGPVAGMATTAFVTAPNWTTQVLRGTTGVDGGYSLTFTATSNRRFSLWANYIPERPIRLCATHAGAQAAVALFVRKRITRAASDLTPTLGQTVRLSGTAYPGAAGQRIHLQRWNGTSFDTIATGQLGDAGSYTFSYRPAARGTHILRAYMPYDAWNVSSASPNAFLKVS